MDLLKKQEWKISWLFRLSLSAGLSLLLSACGSDAAPETVSPYPPEFTGNAWLAGPGGDEEEQWQYDGEDRPLLSVTRENGVCTFDNGLVQVVDMHNEQDEAWHALPSPRPSNHADESAFPPYAFECDESPYSDYRKVMDDEYIWTYSSVNDAMFYGSLTYDMYVKYLGEPPLHDKIRLRVHYASRSRDYAYWDGAYANFSDAVPFFYSTLFLDVVAHEIGHGVLNRISQLDGFDQSLSTDARTLHEVFGDISGLMAKYEFTGHSNNWIHGEKLYYYARYLNQIETEYGAIASYLDYDDADNYYQRIGMMTYPFYLLTQAWGIESAYKVYLDAARTCWVPTTTLPQAAQCIYSSASKLGLSQTDVVAAFKAVKIKLFDEGVLSHYTYEKHHLSINLSDTSISTGQVNAWNWDFADGTRASTQNPVHTYTQAGTYTVTLTVQDDTGDSDAFTRTIKVVAAEP